MPDHRSLIETEEATLARTGGLPIDTDASHALLSVYRAANAVRTRLTNTVLREHDLTWTGFLVLWTLWLWEEMETRDIAESVGISKGTLTGVSQTLLARDLIIRTPSTEDRRLVSLRLSPTGEATLRKLYPDFNAVESRIVARVDAQDLTVMTGALRSLVTAAEEDAS